MSCPQGYDDSSTLLHCGTCFNDGSLPGASRLYLKWGIFRRIDQEHARNTLACGVIHSLDDGAFRAPGEDRICSL